MTTVTLPRRFIRPVATPPARRSMLLGFGATFILGMLLLIGLSIGVGMAAGTTVLRGVSVGGVELGGLSGAAAREHLAAGLPSVSSGQAIVAVDGTDYPIAYADIGRAYDLDAMVDAAMSVGRGSNPLDAGIERLRSLVHPTALPVTVTYYEADALAAAAASVAGQASRYPLEAAVTHDGTTFSVRKSEPGRVLDVDAVTSALAAALKTTSPDDVTVALTPETVPPIIDTASAEAAAEAARNMVADLALEVPGTAEDEEPLTLEAETIASWLTFGPEGSDPYAARIDAGAARSAVAALAEDVDREASNARFAVAPGGGLGGVIASAEGRELQVDETVEALASALKERAGGASVASLPVVASVTQPELTTKAAEALLPKMQLISSWTTYYVPGDGNGWGNNINIPARDIDGRNLMPGEWFSFWGGIGPVTVERGFMYGGVIIGGRSVAGGAIGGGICSTSTTLFNAAMRAGLQIGDRMNHYYYIDRYPDGLDATVYMDENYVQDMTFRNDTDNPIVIRGFGGNGFVTFQIWSVPSGRTVVISDPVTSNYRTAIETTQVSSALAPGTSRRVEYPHNGHDVSRSRFVYDADGNLIHEDHWFSSYRTVNGITLVGPTPAKPTPPADDDDGETAGAGTGDEPPPSPSPGG